MREVVHGRPVNNVDALANPEALEHFASRGADTLGQSALTSHMGYSSESATGASHIGP